MARTKQSKLPVRLKGKRGQWQALAKHYGVSVQTINNWRGKGIDPWNESVVRAYVESNQKSCPDSFKDLAEIKDLNEARLAKIQEETKILRLKFAKEEGLLISKEQAEEEMYAAGCVIKASLTRLENDLPPMLEGQTIAERQKTIREAVRATLNEMASILSGVIERCQDDR